jgi:ketosteroid isomerase-like protein
MRPNSVLSAIVLSAMTLWCVYAQENSQPMAEKYIKESEQQWAEAAKNQDIALIDRIVAVDFLGIAPDGTFYNKSDELSRVKLGGDEVLSNHVNHIKVRFFGDTAVAQGDETWEHLKGDPKRGSYVWTDTWIKRDGKWQVVAAEDLQLPAKPLAAFVPITVK